MEIKSIAREAGNRTKIAVHSNDPNVDAVGACVGMNGARVNAIVNELHGEKIDIITWNDNPAMLIENALSPAKVISVIADAEEKSAKVVVPDYQLSLAIGKEGQNARLAARLTGFKIDIKSETQAREAGDFLDYENEYEDADEYDEYSEYEEDPYGESDDGNYEEDSYGESDKDSYEEDAYKESDGNNYEEDSYEESNGGSYEEDFYEESKDSSSDLNSDWKAGHSEDQADNGYDIESDSSSDKSAADAFDQEDTEGVDMQQPQDDEDKEGAGVS